MSDLDILSFLYEFYYKNHNAMKSKKGYLQTSASVFLQCASKLLYFSLAFDKHIRKRNIYKIII